MKMERKFKLILTILLAVTFTQLIGYIFLYMGYIITNFYIVQNYIVIMMPILLIILLVMKKVKIDLLIFPLAVVITIVGSFPGLIFSDNLQSDAIQMIANFIMNFAILGISYIISSAIYKNLPKYLDMEEKINK